MAADDPQRLEDLLADALAAHDQGGEEALQRFLGEHAADRTALERGLARCRQIGMLGAGPTAPDFPEQLGEFRLVRRLGSGGMGVVYEAEQASLGRRVALKIVRPELLYFEGARERFRREIEAVARLQHPAIVPVLASGEQDGVPFYAMERMHGLTVQEVCQALAERDPGSLRSEDLHRVLGSSDESGTDPLHGPWWMVCARTIHTVALGVRHAHLRGIVHRDIKPSNVMLTRDGRTVLLDFGVALLSGNREFTRSGNNPGSPAFMSPEQLRGDAVDERTDVYSLGATLWQMLCLVPPFRGDKDLQRIRDGEVPSLLQHNREVPRELVVVVQKAMDRDRERRYADVEAFADDLVAVLQRRPIRARRLGLPLRTWRWCQRHRVVATALAALLLVALLLPAMFAWRERALNRELDASLQATLEAIESMLVEVGSERLRYLPGGDETAAAALQRATNLYRGLLRSHPDSERLLGNAVDAMQGLALVRQRTGDPIRAESLLLEALELLGGDAPRPPGQMLKRAFVHLKLETSAELRSDGAAAQRELDAAERDLAATAGAEGLRIDTMRARLEVAIKRSALLDEGTQADAKLAAARAAIELARQLCREKGSASDQRQLITLLRTQAWTLANTGKDQEALPIFDEAIALARSLPKDAAIWPPGDQVLASVLLSKGLALLDLRDPGTPAVLKECLQLREAGVRDHPRDGALRSDLGAVWHALAQMNIAQNQPERALERIDLAIAEQRRVVAEMPHFRQGHDYLRNHRNVRGNLLARLGRTRDLFAVAEELAAMENDAEAQRHAARHLLRVARAQEQAAVAELPEPAASRTRALALLLRAEQLGWGRGNPLDDELYAPLREQADFQALRARLTAKFGASSATGKGAAATDGR